MWISGVRYYSTLALLLPLCISANSNCSCGCPSGSATENGNVCYLIDTLQTSDYNNGKMIERFVEAKGKFEHQINVIGNTENSSKTEKTISELRNTLKTLENKITQVEVWALALQEEVSETFEAAADQREKMRDNIAVLQVSDEKSSLERTSLSGRLEKVEKQSAKTRDELSSKIQQLENTIEELREELSANGREDRRRTKIAKKQIEEVERRILESKTEVLDKMREAERRLSEANGRILAQMKKAQNRLAELSQDIRKVAASLTTEQGISKDLQVKMLETQNTVKSLLFLQNETKDEIRKNMSLSAENLKAYVDDLIKEMKHIDGNLTSEMKIFENSMMRFQHELGNCANISTFYDMDKRLRSHVNVSNSEHQTLRTELSLRVKQLEEKCVHHEDVTAMNITLMNLTSQMNGNRSHLNKNPKKGNESICIDSYPIGYCKRIIETNLCSGEYSAKHCCASCTRAGQMPPKGIKREIRNDPSNLK